jgi:dipeptidyl aminopeptidase/acylaminoacyl peptidase
MAKPPVQTAPYGSWKSPISSALIAEGSIGLPDARLDGDDIYWLELRSREPNVQPAAERYVIVRTAGGADPQDVIAPPFSARTRVHEYGGGAWTVAGGTVYFSNDQRRQGLRPNRRLFRLERGAGTPVALTPEATPTVEWRYADGTIDRQRNRWVGVREEHVRSDRKGAAPKHPDNTIVAVDLGGDGSSPGKILVQGHDFFSSARLSPDGRRLAWLAWDHSNMPWDSTALSVAELDNDGMPGAPTLIAGAAGTSKSPESVFQPEWSPDGSALYFVSDRSGWWNLYRYDLAGKATEPLVRKSAEFGQPQWNFAMATYAFAGRDRIVTAYSANGLGRLAMLDLKSGKLADFDLPFTDYSSVRANGDRVVFRGGASDIPASIVVLDLASGQHRILKQATQAADDPAIKRCFSKAKAVTFPTKGGKQAHGLYYAPHNPAYKPRAGEKPPLVVRCHGGPTSAASSTLNLGIQYWTSRGIAVIDVNYGGSTGYGRAYRERLKGNWGVVDVDDCVNGAKYLAQKGLADKKRSVMTGGSAGGYTTLAALTFRSYFQGGASHYGVSDLAALAKDTHKFEARYLDGLIGKYPEQAALYRARSPLFHASRLTKPVIFFQGDEDAIVPPDQAERMYDALRRKKIPVGYLLFAGESHGFRQAANIQRALDAELAFYSVEVFKTKLSY